MRPAYHALAGIGLGVPLLVISGSWQVAGCFSLATTLMDVDHAVDYAFWGKHPLSLKNFLKKDTTLNSPHMVFIFHGYEWVIIMFALAAMFDHPFIVAVAAGITLHLLMDEVGNRLPNTLTILHPLFYFFSFRLKHRFRASSIYQVRDRNQSVV